MQQNSRGNDGATLSRKDRIILWVLFLNMIFTTVLSPIISLTASATERKTQAMNTEKKQISVEQMEETISNVVKAVDGTVYYVTDTVKNNATTSASIEDLQNASSEIRSELSSAITDTQVKVEELSSIQEPTEAVIPENSESTENATNNSEVTESVEGDFLMTDETIDEQIDETVYEESTYYDEYVETEDYYAEESWTEDTYTAYSYSGPVLTATAGTVQGPSGKETYYNLNMSGVVSLMNSLGYDYTYWVRDDGCKMFGDYIMCAASLDIRPRGSLIETSLGTAIVCDTGTFAYDNAYQLDIATTW